MDSCNKYLVWSYCEAVMVLCELNTVACNSIQIRRRQFVRKAEFVMKKGVAACIQLKPFFYVTVCSFDCSLLLSVCCFLSHLHLFLFKSSFFFWVIRDVMYINVEIACPFQMSIFCMDCSGYYQMPYDMVRREIERAFKRTCERIGLSMKRTWKQSKSYEITTRWL